MNQTEDSDGGGQFVRLSSRDWIAGIGVIVVHTVLVVGYISSLDKRISIIEGTRYTPQMAAETKRETDNRVREIGDAVHRMETVIAGANLSSIEPKLEKIEAKMTKDLDAVRLEIRSLDARGGP